MEKQDLIVLAIAVIVISIIFYFVFYAPRASAQQTQALPYNAFSFSCQQLQGLINRNLTILGPNGECGIVSCIADSGIVNAYLQIYAGKGCYNQT